MGRSDMIDLLLDIRDNHESLLYSKKGILNPDGTIVEPEIWQLDATGNPVLNVTTIYMK